MFNSVCCRPSTTNSDHGLLVRTSLWLNVNINISKKGNLLEEISNAFFAELDNIESLRFVFSNNSFVLGGSKVIDTKQLNGEMLQTSGCLSNGRVCYLLQSFLPYLKSRNFEILFFDICDALFESVCSGKLLQKFVDFTPLIPVKKDSDGSLPKLVPIVKIRKGFVICTS